MKHFSNLKVPKAKHTFDLDISDECLEGEWIKEPWNLAVHAIVRILRNKNNPDINRETLDKVLEKSENYHIGVLYSHGIYSDDGTIRGKVEDEDITWHYSDDHKLIPVQQWVNLHDNKKYGALVVCSCNPGMKDLVVENVPVFYGKGSVGILSKFETVLINPKNRKHVEAEK